MLDVLKQAERDLVRHTKRLSDVREGLEEYIRRNDVPARCFLDPEATVAALRESAGKTLRLCPWEVTAFKEALQDPGTLNGGFVVNQTGGGEDGSSVGRWQKRQFLWKDACSTASMAVACLLLREKKLPVELGYGELEVLGVSMVTGTYTAKKNFVFSEERHPIMVFPAPAHQWLSVSTSGGTTVFIDPSVWQFEPRHKTFWRAWREGDEVAGYATEKTARHDLREFDQALSQALMFSRRDQETPEVMRARVRWAQRAQKLVCTPERVHESLTMQLNGSVTPQLRGDMVTALCHAPPKDGYRVAISPSLDKTKTRVFATDDSRFFAMYACDVLSTDEDFCSKVLQSRENVRDLDRDAVLAMLDSGWCARLERAVEKGHWKEVFGGLEGGKMYVQEIRLLATDEDEGDVAAVLDLDASTAGHSSASAPPPPDRCTHCGASAADLARDDRKLRRCSRCQRVRYCGRECQRAHWRAGHKAECQARGERSQVRSPPLTWSATSRALSGTALQALQALQALWGLRALQALWGLRALQALWGPRALQALWGLRGYFPSFMRPLSQRSRNTSSRPLE